MRTSRLTAVLAAFALGAPIVAAQQPTPPHGPDRQHGHMMDAEGMAARMQLMDSLNARLDTLVSRMNRATGNRKVTAMAEVINELVAQRQAMHERMRRMMKSRKGMKPMTNEPPAQGGTGPRPRADFKPADTADYPKHPSPR
ncbi:MAG TPA: hypothetical protein VH680_05280 [Gemmatimonadales bacterium]|jgi:hypothetical protein